MIMLVLFEVEANINMTVVRMYPSTNAATDNGKPSPHRENTSTNFICIKRKLAHAYIVDQHTLLDVNSKTFNSVSTCTQSRKRIYAVQETYHKIMWEMGVDGRNEWTMFFHPSMASSNGNSTIGVNFFIMGM